MCLAARRSVTSWPSTRFNFGEEPIGLIADLYVSYWTDQDLLYLYSNCDAPWLQRYAGVTNTKDYFDLHVCPLNVYDGLLRGTTADFSWYNHDRTNLAITRWNALTSRSRPRDFV